MNVVVATPATGLEVPYDVTVAGRVVPGVLNVLESCETSRITCPITWVFKILHDRDSNHIVCTLCSSVTLCVVVELCIAEKWWNVDS